MFPCLLLLKAKTSSCKKHFRQVSPSKIQKWSTSKCREQFRTVCNLARATVVI